MENQEVKYRVVEFKNIFTIQRYCKINTGFLWWKKEKFEWLNVTYNGIGYEERNWQSITECWDFLTLEAAKEQIIKWKTESKPIIHEINL